MKQLLLLILVICKTSSLLSQKIKDQYISIKFKSNDELIVGKEDYKTNDHGEPLHLFDSDSSFILGFMSNLEKQFKGFKIPDITFIDSCLAAKYTSDPRKEKVSCKKKRKCTLHDMDMADSWTFNLAAGLSEYGVDSDLPPHPHLCSKCKKWPSDYRERHGGCNKCYDRQIVFCGKTYVCHTCKGKGYYYEDISAKENISFSAFLNDLSTKVPDLIPYFNSANDFGVYDLNKEIKINNTTNSNRLRKLIANTEISFILQKGDEFVFQKIEAYNT
ncbi:hypothetical protein OAN33_07640, partial [Flavobacteriales bacterium]|nr:hypothetical protein [Flavobacteriales bacterium]